MSSFSVMSVNDGNVWCWKVVIAVGGVTGYDKSDGIVIACTHVTDSRSWPCTHNHIATSTICTNKILTPNKLNVLKII